MKENEKVEKKSSRAAGGKRRRVQAAGGQAASAQAHHPPLEWRVAQDRAGRFSTEIFERYQRSEKALVAALVEMYVQGFRRARSRPSARSFAALSLARARLANSIRSSMRNWSALPARSWRPSIPISSSMRVRKRCARRGSSRARRAHRHRHRLGRPAPHPRRGTGRAGERHKLARLSAWAQDARSARGTSGHQR
jgi:hypothetical protein